MAKFRFELLEGKHSDQQGRSYRKGDFVDTDSDLEKSFPRRFRRTQTLAEAKAEAIAPKNGDGGATATPAAAPVALQTAVAPKTSVKVKGLKAKADDASLDARGVDVTKKFPAADPRLLSVFQRGEFFHVFEAGGATPIKEGLKKEEVGAFCKKFLEE